METRVGEETTLEPWTTTITQQPPTLKTKPSQTEQTQTGFNLR